jgi:CRISPR-associated protein Cst2
MTWHLFGNILTNYGTAANNRGENEGNITTLQKILWQGDVHTTVSAEAIRWALRYYWQTSGEYQVNRQWDDDKNDNVWQGNGNFDDTLYIDDDVLGFMRADAAKTEANDEQEPTDGKKKKKAAPKGTATVKRGVLEVTRAVSTIPYAGDITFNATSGQKNRTSLYGTEVHATRYQYGFAMTPDRLKDKSRIHAVLDGLISIGGVAGNHSRFLYDFAPDSIVLRWTNDFSPRLLYCFTEDDGDISAPDLLRRIEAEDIDPNELWIAGAILDTEIGESLEAKGVNAFKGIKLAVEDIKRKIQRDLEV